MRFRQDPQITSFFISIFWGPLLKNVLVRVDRIMTLADSKVRLQFLAFERSLRAVGCDLPLLVFPYGKDRFDLPRNAEWWDEKEFTSWLEQHKAHALMLKYFCLTQANFAFFDCDICFIEDFRKPLAQQNGFVVADTEASKPGWSSTPELANVLARQTSLWSLRLFNVGHFACDIPLYSRAGLRSTCEKYRETCLDFHMEQPGINLLVGLTGVRVTNLCLPPYNMESTMAIDYPAEWENLWEKGRRPYFIHYAGRCVGRYPIGRIFYDYLSQEERKEWAANEAKTHDSVRWLRVWPWQIRLLNRLVQIIDKRFYVQPRPAAHHAGRQLRR
jgi:hypothetical protein